MNKIRNFGTVKLTMFKNEKSTQYKIEKSYKDKDGNWKDTEYMFIEDLLKLQSLINQAVDDHINEREFETNKKDSKPVDSNADIDDEIPF